MRVLVDTNVFLDVMLNRAGLVAASAMALSKVERDGHHALVCAVSLTTLHYMLRRGRGETMARQDVEAILHSMELAPVSRTVLDLALASPMSDFEDAVIAHAAHQMGAQAIITRNLKDFTRSPVPAYTPEQWLHLTPGDTP